MCLSHLSLLVSMTPRYFTSVEKSICSPFIFRSLLAIAFLLLENMITCALLFENFSPFSRPQSMAWLIAGWAKSTRVVGHVPDTKSIPSSAYPLGCMPGRESSLSSKLSKTIFQTSGERIPLGEFPWPRISSCSCSPEWSPPFGFGGSDHTSWSPPPLLPFYEVLPTPCWGEHCQMLLQYQRRHQVCGYP